MQGRASPNLGSGIAEIVAGRYGKLSITQESGVPVVQAASQNPALIRDLGTTAVPLESLLRRVAEVVNEQASEGGTR